MGEGWTRHGHAIEGVVQEGVRPSVARCGGPTICRQCAIDSTQAQARWRREHAERMVMVNAVDLKIILDLYEKGDTTSWPDADVALERLYQALGSPPSAPDPDGRGL